MKADLTVKQAQERLGLPAKSTFWRSIWRGVEAGVVVMFQHGKTCFTFDAASIEAWRNRVAIRSPQDLSRLTDNRRTA